MFKYTFEDDFVLFNSEKLTENIVYLTERVGTDAREGQGRSNDFLLGWARF
jgi:hypothetical protein